MIKFRDLTQEDIDVRIGMVKVGKGASLLLYKDARVDIDVLNNSDVIWKREHNSDASQCTVSIWNEDIKQWVCRTDVGTESNVEKAKGMASDSFKRSCVNWGIGIELYTSPFIWVKNDNKYEKYKCYHLKIENKQIIELGIEDSKGNKVFKYQKQ